MLASHVPHRHLAERIAGMRIEVSPPAANAPCAMCGGSGHADDTTPCTDCYGAGDVYDAHVEAERVLVRMAALRREYRQLHIALVRLDGGLGFDDAQEAA